MKRPTPVRPEMSTEESSVTFETVHEHARREIERWFGRLLEAEVTALLGRVCHQRRPVVDAAPGYRNGHGKP